MLILSSQDLESINNPESLTNVFIKLGYQGICSEIALEDLELTLTQELAVERAYLIANYQRNALQVILFELKPDHGETLKQRLAAIAKNLSQRPTLFIILGTVYYETLSLIHVSQEFDKEMNLTTSTKEAKIDLNQPTIFDVNLLQAIAPQNLPVEEVYQSQRRHIEYYLSRTKDRKQQSDLIRYYLTEIGRIPLLRAEEEIYLARQLEILGAVEATRELLQEEFKQSSSEAEIAATLQLSVLELRKAIKAAEKAKSKLVQANLRLVVSIAKKYANRGLDLLELIQEGNLGLMRAVEKFDYRKGNKFSTYATHWIRQFIHRAIQDKSRSIRLPVHLWDTYSQIRKALTTDYQGYQMSSLEAAEKLDISLDKLQTIQRSFLNPVSLSSQVGAGDDNTLENLISDQVSNNLLEEYVQAEFYQYIREEALNGLSDREREVIILRFGLLGDAPLTLAEIGQKMNVTRERVRQIEAKSLKKIRAKFAQQKLRSIA